MPIPTATKSITSNGNNIDVKDYAKVNVNVPSNATIKSGTISHPESKGYVNEIVDCGWKPKIVFIYWTNIYGTAGGGGYTYVSSSATSGGAEGYKLTPTITNTGFTVNGYASSYTVWGTCYWVALTW